MNQIMKFFMGIFLLMLLTCSSTGSFFTSDYGTGYACDDD